MSRELFNLFMVILVGQLASGSDISLLSAASSAFSVNLYQQIAIDKENVVYSPLSIHLALTLPWYGARETTATEMADTLSLTQFGDSSPHQAYHDVIQQFNSVSDVELYTSNAIFVKPDFPIEADFVREAKENYFSLASNFDLNAPGGPEKTINDYVNEKTHGVITEILPPGTIDDLTVLVIINTLFFNGTWETQFDKRKTSNQDFYKLNGVTTKVDMMRDTRLVNFKRDENLGVDIVELTFKNKRFGLYIVLPRERDGINSLESWLQSPGTVDECLDGLESTMVDLSIPKFKIETSLSLKDPLQNMGMPSAFNPNLANFRGISNFEIYISKVLHKAVIEVQETGTVAAAATAVVMVLRSQPLPEYVFTADRPFLFFLRDNETKQILFQGRFSG